MGGKASQGTPADKRLSDNKPTSGSKPSTGKATKPAGKGKSK